MSERVWVSEWVGESHSVVSDSLWPHGLHSPQNSPGQNTEVGSLFLLQGIFPNQGSNPGLLHWRQILYQLSHKGSVINTLALRYEKTHLWFLSLFVLHSDMNQVETPYLIMIEKMTMQTGVSYKMIFVLLYVNIEHHLMNSVSAPLLSPFCDPSVFSPFFPCLSFCLWVGERCDRLTKLCTLSALSLSSSLHFHECSNREWNFYP